MPNFCFINFENQKRGNPFNTFITFVDKVIKYNLVLVNKPPFRLPLLSCYIKGSQAKRAVNDFCNNEIWCSKKTPEKNEPSSVAKRETLLLIILLTGIPRHPKNVTFLRDDHIKLLDSQQQKHFREEKNNHEML